MTAKKNTQKYVVTQPNTMDYEVGQTVSLTPGQAAALVNKVRLLDDVKAEGKGAAAAKTAADKLQKEIDGLNELVANLTAENTQLKADATPPLG